METLAQNSRGKWALATNLSEMKTFFLIHSFFQPVAEQKAPEVPAAEAEAAAPAADAVDAAPEAAPEAGNAAPEAAGEAAPADS